MKDKQRCAITMATVSELQEGSRRAAERDAQLSNGQKIERVFWWVLPIVAVFGIGLVILLMSGCVTGMIKRVQEQIPREEKTK